MGQNDTNNKTRLEKLQELTRGKRKVLIVTHNHPDPDALAAAFALKYLLQSKWKVGSIIASSGVVGRAENRAMIRHLKIDLRALSEINLNNYSVIALVDTQPGAGNNSLPKSIIPDIVIDHHVPFRAKTRLAKYYDIRTDYGSTSTILAEYLEGRRDRGGGPQGGHGTSLRGPVRHARPGTRGEPEGHRCLHVLLQQGALPAALADRVPGGPAGLPEHAREGHQHCAALQGRGHPRPGPRGTPGDHRRDGRSHGPHGGRQVGPVAGRVCRGCLLLAADEEEAGVGGPDRPEDGSRTWGREADTR